MAPQNLDEIGFSEEYTRRMFAMIANDAQKKEAEGFVAGLGFVYIKSLSRLDLFSLQDPRVFRLIFLCFL